MKRQSCMPLYRFFDTIRQTRVAELRGGPVFDIISENERFAFGRNGPYHVFQAEDRGIPVGRGVLYADLALALDVLPRFRHEYDPLLVLDVHFPLTAPELMSAITDDEEVDPEASWELAKYWADPYRESRALEEVIVADVVTVSRQEWADLLAGLNDNIIVLPDVHDLTTAVDFFSIFSEAVLRAARYKYMPWWQRVLTAPLWPSVKRLIRDREDGLRQELVKRGWQ